jgi:diacylglycerol kinase (ATP)
MQSTIPIDPSETPRAFTFTGRLRSVRYAVRGVRTMLAGQHNAWLHAASTVAVVAAGLVLRVERVEWCCLVVAMMAVWTAEALNTAFEFLCDVASPAFHPLVAKSKDVAAGAVLLSAAGAIAIGLLIFVPHLRQLW